ncbi:response regulator transcription factor [Lacipirellula limnantheis]|uniref:Transcriptional regulatory protein FixJ n=1 Tax=Lacipirellula limnantheis TaxID=2528024 RepID=A0A517TTC5_9BACT|nr:LuxR C-terminal-related transcriptional regulator [Lacipirellula limnantheis]QDT71631.1 Transcriptional regulatory protein FixJ [Lacipirellula limnantheis]
MTDSRPTGVNLSPAVYIIDVDPEARASLVKLVASMGFAPVAFGSREDYVTSLDANSHGCVLLSLHAPASAGLDLLQELTNLPNPMPVIIVTDCNAVPPAVRAMQLGVEAYLQKNCFSETTLWESIHAAFARDAVQRAAYQRREDLLSRLNELSPRERRVLEMLVQGCDHRQISDELNVSRRTVENRRARIMQKFGVDTFPQLIAIAIELGLPADAKQ